MEKMTGVKFSIILPVYNGERRIRTCLESILRQEEKNFELIIIDDGSRDGSKKEIEKIIQENIVSQIKIHFVSRENQGVASTRNQGIEMAQGEYVTFVDQDDYLDPQYCKNMLKEIEKKQSDILVAGYIRITEDGKELYRQKLEENAWSPYIVTAPWAHLYRREFLLKHKIQFLTTGIGEDVYFNMMAYSYTDKIVVYPYEGYYWVDNPKSVSNTSQVSITKKADPFLLLNRLEQDLPDENPSKTSYREYYMVRYIVWYLLYTLPGSQWKDVVEMQERLFLWLKEHYPEYGKNPNISFLRPKGDTRVNRWSVWVCVQAKKIGMLKPVLKVLSWVL